MSGEVSYFSRFLVKFVEIIAAGLASTTLAEFIHAAALCIANFGSEDTAVAVVERRARE